MKGKDAIKTFSGIATGLKVVMAIVSIVGGVLVMFQNPLIGIVVLVVGFVSTVFASATIQVVVTMYENIDQIHSKVCGEEVVEKQRAEIDENLAYWQVKWLKQMENGEISEEEFVQNMGMNDGEEDGENETKEQDEEARLAAAQHALYQRLASGEISGEEYLRKMEEL